MQLQMNHFDKRKYQTARQMAQRYATGEAERFNEPAIILEGPDEFVVLRGIVWNARDSWGQENLPTWAKGDPESKVVEIFEPEDHLAGNYTKATKIVERMRKKAQDLRYDDRFNLTELCRDYPEVRMMLDLVESAASNLENVLVHTTMAVDDAIRHHKKNGKPKRKE